MILHELTICQAHKLIKQKDISSQELARAFLDRIQAVEDNVGAFITVDDEAAMEQAKRADKAISKGEIFSLTGIPVSVKDAICTKGLRTTCASKILEHFVPFYDAFVIKKLKEQGAVIIGKANMDEFAMGSSTENSGFKKTKNPWDLTCIPGGSSGGSAASVASGMCMGSLGSDTGGSIRQPASHCGVVGMKPTYGRVSRFGLVAFASSLDQIGPIAGDVKDCALIMNAIAGYDPHDSTSVPQKTDDYTLFCKKGLKDLTVGIPKEYIETNGIDPDVARSVKQAIKTIEGLGAVCRQVSLPHSEHAVASYYIISSAEASSNLARYDGVKYGLRNKDKNSLVEMYESTRSSGFGSEVVRRIIIGTYALSAGYYDAYYKKALQVRTLIMEDFSKAFDACDIIISPVAPTPAFKIGEKIDDPLKMYLSDVFTLSANLVGVPGMSIPCGFSSEGLPIGLQLIGKHFEEGKLFKLAYNFEQATDFHKQKPLL